MKFGYMLAGTEGIVTAAEYEAYNTVTGFESLADENLAMIEVSDAYSAFESVAYASDIDVECGMEADTTPDKNLKWYQKVWEWIKNIFKSLWGYIKTAYNWLKKKIFGDKSAVAQEKKVVEETAEVVEEAYQEVVKQGLLTMKEKVSASAGGGNTTPPPSSGPTSTRTEQTTPTSPASNVIVPEYKGPTVTAEPSVIIPEYKGEPVPEPVVEVVQKIVAKKPTLLSLPDKINKSYQLAVAQTVTRLALNKDKGKFTMNYLIFKFPDGIKERFNKFDFQNIVNATIRVDDISSLESNLGILTSGYMSILYLLFGDKYGRFGKNFNGIHTSDKLTLDEIITKQKELKKETDRLLDNNITFNLQTTMHDVDMVDGKINRSDLDKIYSELKESIEFSSMMGNLLTKLEAYMEELNRKVQEYDAYKAGSNTHLNGKEVDAQAMEDIKKIRVSVVRMGQLSKAVVKCIGEVNLHNIYKNIANIDEMNARRKSNTEEVA